MTAEMEKRKRMAVFSGSSNLELADKIAQELGISLGNVKLEKFANGEIYARYLESVRGADVFIVQSVCSSPNGFDVNDNLMELLIMIDAAKRASAHSVSAVITHYGYARQDRKAAPREPITAKLVADLLSIALVHSICLRLGRALEVLRRGLRRLYQSSFFVYLSHCLFLTLGTAFLQRRGVGGLSVLLAARLLICYTLPFLAYFLYDSACTRLRLRWRLLG